MVGVRDGGEEVLGGVRKEKMVMFLLPAGGAWHIWLASVRGRRCRLKYSLSSSTGHINC